jgi:protein-disulfide isomerase
MFDENADPDPADVPVRSGPPGGDRREAARRKARAAQARARRRERAAKILVRGGVAVGAVVVATTLAFTLVTSGSATTGPAPANTATDGVRIGPGFVAERSPAREVRDEPTSPTTHDASDVADIAIYVDYHCPSCRRFELENADYLTGLLESGAATVQIHPLALTDSTSQGTRYATRAAAAAACVADLEPDRFWSVHRALVEAQPDRGTRGLADDELSSVVASAAEFDDPAAVTECIADQRFAGWVGAATRRALAGPLPYDSVDAITGTPSVFVNGSPYDPSRQTFPDFVVSKLGSAYAAETAGGAE